MFVLRQAIMSLEEQTFVHAARHGSLQPKNGTSNLALYHDLGSVWGSERAYE